MKYVMSILVLLTMFYSAPIFGQSIVTIRWGGNLTKLGGLVRIGQPRKSISMGVSVAIPIRDRFSLQFSGDYMPKGVREDLHYGHLILDIDYVEFSGLGIVTIISPRRAPSLFILAGPTVAFKDHPRQSLPAEYRELYNDSHQTFISNSVTSPSPRWITAFHSRSSSRTSMPPCRQLV